MGCSWPMHNVKWYTYPYYDIQNPELYNWKIHWNQAGNINSIMSSNTPSWSHQLLVCICILERAYFNYLECSYKTWCVYNNNLSIRIRTKVVRRKHIIQPTGIDAYSSTVFWRDEEKLIEIWSMQTLLRLLLPMWKGRWRQRRPTIARTSAEFHVYSGPNTNIWHMLWYTVHS